LALFVPEAAAADLWAPFIAVDRRAVRRVEFVAPDEVPPRELAAAARRRARARAGAGLGDARARGDRARRGRRVAHARRASMPGARLLRSPPRSRPSAAGSRAVVADRSCVAPGARCGGRRDEHPRDETVGRRSTSIHGPDTARRGPRSGSAKWADLGVRGAAP